MADALGLVARLQSADAELRAAQTAGQAAQSRRNDTSKLIGAAKAQKDEARAQALMAEVAELKTTVEAHYAREGELGRALKDELGGAAEPARGPTCPRARTRRETSR